MSQILSDVTFILLTVLMGIIDFIPSMAYALQSVTSKFLVSGNVAKRNALDWIYTLVWITVGIVVLIISRPVSVMTLFVFLTFKSGSDLGARAIYIIHDAALLKEKSFSKLFAVSVLMASLPSLLFIMIWRTFQHLFTYASALFLGVSTNNLPLYLWMVGIAFGLAFGVVRSKGESGILLRGELFLVMGSSFSR